MGKRLIISGASFASAGIPTQYVTRETLTEQGFVVQSSGTEYRTLAKTNTVYYGNYVKNKESIVLYPGDTIVFMENESMCQYSIYCYLTVTSNYPSYTAGTTTKYVSSASPALRNTFNSSSHNMPAYLKNTTESPLYVVLQGRGGLSSRCLLSPEQCPKLTYRIYTDDTSRYPEPEEEENNE